MTSGRAEKKANFMPPKDELELMLSSIDSTI
jgi:hypothetical protein